MAHWWVLHLRTKFHRPAQATASCRFTGFDRSEECTGLTEHYIETSSEQLAKNEASTADLQGQLWAAIVPAAKTQPDQVQALVVSGMNDVLNRQGYTQAAFLNRVPIAAWILMFVIAVFCNLLLGYRAVGKAPVMFVILPVALAISFFLVSDIDSPRHGVILVRPQNLEILANSLK